MPEARVLRQLVEALLFERIASWPSERCGAHASGERELTFSLGTVVYRCRARVAAFGRVRVTAGSVQKLAPSTWRETSWSEVLADVPGDPSVKAAIAEELENTARLCRWNQEHLPALRRSRRALPYQALEGLLHEGHPYHPCFKSRTGFSLADQAAYGPEAGNPFELRWLAVRRARLCQTFPTSEAEHFRSELGATGYASLVAAQRAKGADVAQYGLLPVHPWQWQKLAGWSALKAAQAGGEVVDLGFGVASYRASQSLRTLLPVSNASASHIKLPLAVRVSSSLRTLQPETVKSAPALSAWLQAAVASDPFFEQVAGAVVLGEHASSLYEPAGPGGAELDGHLAAIWRQPVGPRLREGERAVPFNALFAVEHDGDPHVDVWVREHGLSAWLEQLLRVTVLPLWRLLSRHGIALEAHAQNLLLLHREGWPERLALRDFHDSVEYVPSFLADPSRLPRWEALDARFGSAAIGRHYAMHSVVELRELFIDTVMVFNLSELSWLLEQRYGFAESDFWRLARKVLSDYGRSRWCDPARDAALGWGEPFVRTESLFRARLRAPSTELSHHWVPSALHDHAGKELHAGHQ
ncbi:MAG: rhizobactin siderophore biosynthesis protein RhsF [Myxococcales bacterium]|nr:MAG: rhizobactin siderophore biosynthesis protein RhsF [Myxococcales bacterium]